MEINRGSSGVIRVSPKDKNIVIKKSKKKNYLEYNFHIIAYNLSQKYKILKVPKPLEVLDEKTYSMERIDDKKLLIFSVMSNEQLETYEEFLEELRDFYRKMICINVFPYDFELYTQKDNTIMLLDFDKFITPVPQKKLIKYYLIHPILPKKFYYQ